MALRQMPEDVFPSLGIPTIYVAQPYGGMDPAQMEGFLTYYYEYHFLYIGGIEHVESKSIQGAALIKLQFHPGTDMAQAMAETVSYVNRARAFMPPGTVPPFVMRFDAGSVPVGDLVFESDTRSAADIQDVALNKVRPLFATLPGVSAPPPFGGSQRTIVVHVLPDRLQRYNMSLDEIVTAVTNANSISPSGNVRIGDKMPMVPSNATVRDIHTLDAVPIRTGSLNTVFLRDVGWAEDSTDIPTGLALVNGHRTVYIPVTKRADASTVAVVAEVKQNMARFQAVLPDDVKVSYQFDQSPFVTRSIRGLVLEAALGAFLTSLMVWLFLRDLRSALIVVLNIPLALLGSVIALWLCHMTINLMTLGGLALAVGVLVDEATVTMENQHAHLATGASLGRAVLEAGKEVALPLLVSMLCVLAVFVPSFFMSGVARALFVPLSLAVGFSMIASYLLSRTFVPVLSAWLLGAHAPAGPNAFDRLQQRYAQGVDRLLAWRGPLLAAYVLLCALVVGGLGLRLGTEIFPTVEAGQFTLRMEAPPGTRLEKTEKLTLRTLDAINEEAGGKDGVALSLAFVGTQPAAYPVNTIHLWTSGTDEAVTQVQLSSRVRSRVADFEERLRGRLRQTLPDCTYSFEPSDIVSRVLSLGATTPIEVAVSGPQLEADRAFAERIRDAVSSIGPLRDVRFAEDLAYPTLDVDIDRLRTGLLDTTASDVARSLLSATSSSRFVVPDYWRDPNSGVAYQVQVEVPTARMDSVQAVQNLPVKSSRSGQQYLLRNLATVKAGHAVGEYDRYNMQRTVTLTANVFGADLGSVSRRVEQAVRSLGAPPRGVSVSFRGEMQPLGEVFSDLGRGLLMSIVVVFLLLSANFQSWRLATIVVSTVPAVLSGVVLLLWVTGTTLNLQSFMGAIMAVGVAVANAILLVTFAERERMRGVPARQAAIEGARSRLRPILMTSLAMLAGMLPMALALSEGGEQSAPLGRAVMGGLTAATVATLFILPAAFALVQRHASTHSASLDPDDVDSPLHDTAGARPC